MYRQDNREIKQTPILREINIALSRSEVNSESSLYYYSIIAIYIYSTKGPGISTNPGTSSNSLELIVDTESSRVILSNIELKVIS
jgi:hypothetical protein